MTDEEVAQYLRMNNLIVERDGILRITGRLKRAWNKSRTFVLQTPSTGVATITNQVAANVSPQRTSKDYYKEFIKLAEVPGIIDTGTLRFRANAYSKEAEKVFAQIMKEGKVNLQALLIATKLYYKRQDLARQMIGNYFIKGTWESVYEEFMDKVKHTNGDIGSYIENQLKEGNGERKYEQGI